MNEKTIGETYTNTKINCPNCTNGNCKDIKVREPTLSNFKNVAES